MAYHVNCPQCGAALKPRTALCPYCSSPLEKLPVTQEERDSAILLIRSANSNLEQVTTPRLIASFLAGVVCAPVLAYVVASASGAGNGTCLVIAGIAVLAGFFVVGMILPVEEDRKFDGELIFRINALIEKTGMETEEFLALARKELKENAPLLRQLDKLIR